MVPDDEYERVCEALSTTLRLLREERVKGDQARKERDYFFVLAGGALVESGMRRYGGAHITALANGYLQRVLSSAKGPVGLRAEVEKWLAEHGDQVP